MLNVYGIGNPLIDYICSVTEKDLDELGLSKGTMLLIDTEKQKEIVEHTKDRPVRYSCGGSCPNTMVTLASLELKPFCRAASEMTNSEKCTVSD